MIMLVPYDCIETFAVQEWLDDHPEATTTVVTDTTCRQRTVGS